LDARQIQELRAMLAAQTAEVEARPPTLARKLSRLLAPRTSPWKPASPRDEAAAPPQDAEIEAPLLLDQTAPVESVEDVGYGSLSAVPALPAPEPIPPQILLGDLRPRRSAFGQRSEPVLELHQPVITPSRRLTLMASDGAAVGEIILHANGTAPAPDFSTRLPSLNAWGEPLHAETPFFPEDLVDEPRLLGGPSRLLPTKPRALKQAAKRKPAPARIAPQATPALAGAYLLATLAARLAGEQAALAERLAALADAA
jgi:hypothetical protein